MSEFHKYLRELKAEYDKEGVEDPYHVKTKIRIFRQDVQKFERSPPPQNNPLRDFPRRPRKYNNNNIIII